MAEGSETTIAVVGSTGSIGTQTVEVVTAANRRDHRFRVMALAAHSNVATVVDQAHALRPDVIAMVDLDAAGEVRSRVDQSVEVLAGAEALAVVASEADITVNGVVGFAGLPATLACLNAGKRLALANKESLISAGPVVQQARRTPHAEIVPVDSEHAALHQCLLSAGSGRTVAKLQLTASGGPFRGRTVDELGAVTVADALAHPTWAMGPKITVDSSTLMNKGLEVIEAVELFGAPSGESTLGYDDVEVVVHPQSIVHSMVTFTDGSTIAQLSEPDMRLPIGYALAHPGRLDVPFGKVDWTDHKTLTFEPPDLQAFHCLNLAFAAGRLGGGAPAWLSAANEVAVDAFLAEQIRWSEIPEVVERVMMCYQTAPADTLEDVLCQDAEARNRADEIVKTVTCS